MTVPVFAAAKRICERSGWSLSNLGLQKLLYIIHMSYLGNHDEPLIRGHFEAWDYGPVQPDLYHKAKIFGSSPVGNIFHSDEELGDCAEASMIDDAVAQLSNATPGRLVAITHWEGGAWHKNYVHGGRGSVIPNEDILQEYRDRQSAVATKKT